MADGSGKKSQNWESNRIKHALHLPGWVFRKDSETTLRANGKPVLVSEYQADMKGSLFCPECCCPLFRSPLNEEANKTGKNAFYAHRRNIVTECGLRTKKAEGKKYLSEEEAAQAIVDGKLVIVEGFLQSRPATPEKQAEVYSQSAVEDQDGEIASVPIARHRGRSFNLPAKLTTVRGLCRKFDDNLYKYYVFPGAKHARLLLDSLRNISIMDSPTQSEILGFGRITSIWDAGSNPHNIRFVKLEFNRRGGYADFSIKIQKYDAELHDLNEGAIGKFVLFYGIVRESGVGLAVSNLAWGEVSLLPAKYDQYLI
ncbi:hypothetical protein NJC38_02550 [Pseudomonas sp. 21LCFQ010]|uniref:hypothetical protein n=1 Tax=Pseudomonas sp. 21LCFQ010 TaxID=2957506 RepID=UPI00209727CB|nr:hypothetical protein [Pseudomonas sp. 21LCFQ010]MCO8161030.1 hypothetical protein [Pseudomonas sp. 21LCFQ010]